jgi:hypothetical protein
MYHAINKKIEATGSFEKFVTTYQAIRCLKPEKWGSMFHRNVGKTTRLQEFIPPKDTIKY